MSCIRYNGGAPEQDAYFSNVSVGNILSACQTYVSQSNPEREIITLVEDPVEVGVYLIRPSLPVCIVNFSDAIQYNKEITINIDSSNCQVNFQIIYMFKSMLFDAPDTPVNTVIHTDYPTYYFSGQYYCPYQTTSVLLLHGPYKYDDVNYIPGRQVIEFIFDGECWGSIFAYNYCGYTL